MNDLRRKSFASFDEIDQALEVLALEKQLTRIKLSRSTGKVLESLSPSNLAMDSLGIVGDYLRGSGAVQKVVVLWLARRFLK
jgi:hypothetical protein